MARRRTKNAADKFEAAIKGLIALVLLLALVSGGIEDLAGRFLRLLLVVGYLAVIGGAIYLIVLILKRTKESGHTLFHPKPSFSTENPASAFVGRSSPSPRAPRQMRPQESAYTSNNILERLAEIDW